MTPKDQEKLGRLMRRTRITGPADEIGYLGPHDGLCRPAAVLQELALKIGRLSIPLPRVLDEDVRRILGKLAAGGGALLHRVRFGLLLLGPLAQVRPTHLRDLDRRASKALALWQVAGSMKDDAMCARAVLAGFGWQLLDQVISAVAAEYRDTASQSEGDRVLDAFAHALFQYDKVLKHSPRRRQEIEAYRAMMAQEMKETQDTAFLKKFTVQFRHNIGQPSWDDLIAATKIYQRIKASQPPDPSLLQDLPMIVPGGGPPRKIFQ